MMRISLSGLSSSSVWTFSMAVQTSIPFTTLPKTVCLLSSQGVGTVVIKTVQSKEVHRWQQQWITIISKKALKQMIIKVGESNTRIPYSH